MSVAKLTFSLQISNASVSFELAEVKVDGLLLKQKDERDALEEWGAVRSVVLTGKSVRIGPVRLSSEEIDDKARAACYREDNPDFEPFVVEFTVPRAVTFEQLLQHEAEASPRASTRVLVSLATADGGTRKLEGDVLVVHCRERLATDEPLLSITRDDDEFGSDCIVETHLTGDAARAITKILILN